MTDLLKQLVRKNYRKNLLKTLDYDITYKGARDQAGDTRVITEAKYKLKPRDPPVRVDYVVKQTTAGYIVVDFVTEGSSLTKNYYDQFRRRWTTRTRATRTSCEAQGEDREEGLTARTRCR